MRRGLALLIVAGGSVLLSACPGDSVESDPSAVTVDDGSARLVYDLGLCDGDEVRSVELRSATDSDVLFWRIEADDPVPVESVVVGAPVPGFTETVPMTQADLPDQLVLSQEFGGDGRQHSQQFSRRALEPGVYIRDYVQLSPGDIDSDREERCDDDLFMDFTVPSSVDAMVVGVVIVGFAAIALLAWRRGREERLRAG